MVVSNYDYFNSCPIIETMYCTSFFDHLFIKTFLFWGILTQCSFLIQGPQYLGYLTSEQALADFAVLIRHLKVNIKGT